MKILKLVYLLFMVPIAFAQSNEYLDFYPLQIGNKWIMHSQAEVSPFEEYYYVSVEKDTIINGKTYFVIKIEYPNGSTYSKFERIDSSTSQVMRYDSYYSIEYIIDSLKAEGEDFFEAERYYFTYPSKGLTQCYWMKMDTILNIPTTVKTFQGINAERQPPAYILGKGFGLVEILGYQWKEELVYAKINGIEYGKPIVNILESNSRPIEFILNQNYPNPFNSSTKISFTAPQKCFVEINVYNVLGKKIITLLDDDYDTGFYEITFDGKELPSGIYFYQLKVSSKIITKQMLLLK